VPSHRGKTPGYSITARGDPGGYERITLVSSSEQRSVRFFDDRNHTSIWTSKLGGQWKASSSDRLQLLEKSRHSSIFIRYALRVPEYCNGDVNDQAMLYNSWMATPSGCLACRGSSRVDKLPATRSATKLGSATHHIINHPASLTPSRISG
jgi:hypothetical protein